MGFLRILSIIVVFGFSSIASAKITEYYTTVGSLSSSAIEGNKISNGQLYWYGGKRRGWVPFKAKYCPYGVGHRNNCITPCVHGAAAKGRKVGSVVKVPTYTCPWGPLKGKKINKVIIADTGGWIHGNDIDIFKGICAKTKGGRCIEWAPDTYIAKYGRGRNMTWQMAAKEAYGSRFTGGTAIASKDTKPAPVPEKKPSTVSPTSVGYSNNSGSAGFFMDFGGGAAVR